MPSEVNENLVDMEQNTSLNSPTESSQLSLDDDNDYLIGYDYCGVPQYPDGCCYALSCSESDQQGAYKCTIGTLNGHMV